MTQGLNILKKTQLDKNWICFFNGICLTEDLDARVLCRDSEMTELSVLPDHQANILMVYDDYDHEQVLKVDARAHLNLVLVYLHAVNHRLVIDQAHASQLTVFQVAIESDKLDNSLSVNLSGEASACSIRGIQLTGQQQSISTQLSVIHHVSNAMSDIRYKSIADQRSGINLSVRIKVLEAAVKSSSDTNLDNMLLSNTASIDAAPELEIYADDVKCSHGATVGDLNEESLFYLLSRGIDREQARSILIQAFMEPLIEELDSTMQPSVKESICSKLQSMGAIDFSD